MDGETAVLCINIAHAPPAALGQEAAAVQIINPPIPAFVYSHRQAVAGQAGKCFFILEAEVGDRLEGKPEGGSGRPNALIQSVQ